MQTIGNIIWILLGGIWTALCWAVFGLFFYITIIGIPLGRQAFKMAKLSLAPFGATVAYGGGAPSLLANIVWLPLGLFMAFTYVIVGLLNCITIIAFPFGIQAFKMAKLSLLPFGAQVY